MGLVIGGLGLGGFLFLPSRRELLSDDKAADVSNDSASLQIALLSPGPKLLAETELATGSFLPAFKWLTPLAILLAILLAIVAWITKMPKRKVACGKSGPNSIPVARSTQN